MTWIVPVRSSDNAAGRVNGTSAPNLCAMLAISASSVDTTTWLKQPLCRAASIDQAIFGFPQNSLMFFRGIRLLPPRAGMIATLMKEPHTSHQLLDPVVFLSYPGTSAG